MKKRWFLVAALLTLLVVGGFAWWNGRETYIRYVSPPLPDGTHYTFLYPARMTNTTHHKWQTVVISGLTNPSLKERISALLSGRGVAAGRVTSLLAVIVRATKKGEKPVLRHDVRSASQHDVWLYQAKQRRLFILMHNAQFTPLQQFKREAKVVSDSFRILPPGAPIPTP